MLKKLKVHLLTLPRWFAIPYFGASILLGAVLAGGQFNNPNLYLAFVACLLVMAGGHSFNTFLDYAWTKLDVGEVENRSAEKDYTGGQNVIENKSVSLHGVFSNAICWYVLSAIPIVILCLHSTPLILIPWILGMSCTVWYSISKFNYTHELALGVAVGPLPVLIGMFAVNASPPIMNGILVSLPFAMTLSFMGLALDEWPDAEANLKKGVKSVAYKVWEYTHQYGLVGLMAYCIGWIVFMASYQTFLVSIGILHPMTGIAFIPLALLIPLMVMLTGNFRKTMMPVVAVGALYCILILVGQIIH